MIVRVTGTQAPDLAIRPASGPGPGSESAGPGPGPLRWFPRASYRSQPPRRKNGIILWEPGIERNGPPNRDGGSEPQQPPHPGAAARGERPRYH